MPSVPWLCQAAKKQRAGLGDTLGLGLVLAASSSSCRRTVPQPCLFSSWEDLRACHDALGSPRDFVIFCSTSKLSQAWTDCTATCGDGWRTRRRQIEARAGAPQAPQQTTKARAESSPALLQTCQVHAHRGGMTCDGTLKEIDKCTKEGHLSLVELADLWVSFSSIPSRE